MAGRSATHMSGQSKELYRSFPWFLYILILYVCLLDASEYCDFCTLILNCFI